MKDPHDKTNYEQVDGGLPPQTDDNTDIPPATPDEPPAPAQKKSKLSGAYYYVEKDEKKLAEFASIRTILAVMALMLQLVVLCLPQGSLEYVTITYPSFSFCYMIAVFVLIIISIWLFVMIALRYKISKRIPKEYAPKSGFKRRAFFGNELYISINAVILIFEIAFLCFKYDGVGLAGMFVCALALGASIASRQVTHYALKESTLVPAPDSQKN